MDEIDIKFIDNIKKHETIDEDQQRTNDYNRIMEIIESKLSHKPYTLFMRNIILSLSKFFALMNIQFNWSDTYNDKFNGYAGSLYNENETTFHWTYEMIDTSTAYPEYRDEYLISAVKPEKSKQNQFFQIPKIREDRDNSPEFFDGLPDFTEIAREKLAKLAGVNTPEEAIEEFNHSIEEAIKALKSLKR